jgi:lipooligosaccharide transport system permease protein
MAEATAIGPATEPGPARPLRRFEPGAMVGVWMRELTLFKRLWASTTFSSIVEPTIYLLAFGFGFGALVTTVDGIPYIEYVATGAVATAVLFSSVFAGMFNTFVKRVYQKTYDGVLATPVDVPEIMTAEAIWIAGKAGIYGCAPLLVGFFFGLTPAWGMLAVPFIGFLTGLGFAFAGQWLSGVVPSIDSSTTSPAPSSRRCSSSPARSSHRRRRRAQVLAQVNPLYHCVQLVRHACFGWEWINDAGNVAFLVVFAVITAALSWRRMSQRLVD